MSKEEHLFFVIGCMFIAAILLLGVGTYVVYSRDEQVKKQVIDPVQFWKTRYEDMSKQFLALQAERNKPDLVYKIDGKNYECFEIKKLGE